MCYSSMCRSRSSAFREFKYSEDAFIPLFFRGASVVWGECAHFGTIVPIVVAFVFVCGFSFVLAKPFSLRKLL